MRTSSCSPCALPTSVLEMGPFALGSDDEDEISGPVDCTEPMRRPSGELCSLSGIEKVVVLAEEQAEAPADDVEPVMAVVHLHSRWRRPSSRSDVHLVGAQPPTMPATGEGPDGQPVEAAR